MKKIIISFLTGVIFATTATVYADEGLEKIEAYLRPSLPITLNGQPVTLESSPVMYDGSTYLKLRDLAALTGLQVNWNDASQTVELGLGEGGSTVAVAPKTDYDTSSKRSYDIPISGEIIPHEIGAMSDSEMILAYFKIYKLNDYMSQMEYIVDSYNLQKSVGSPDAEKFKQLSDEAKEHLNQDEPNIEKMQLLMLNHGLQVSLQRASSIEKKISDVTNKKWETEQLTAELQKVKYDIALYSQEINKRI